MLLIAHRGFSRKYPENTLLSFKKALEYGAKAIELDIRITSDNEFVIIHDVATKRVSSVNRIIAKSSAASILQTDVSYPAKFGNAFKGEKIILLDKFISEFSGKLLLITELKSSFSKEQLMKLSVLLRAFDLKDVIISSKKLKNLFALREIGFGGNIAYIADKHDINWGALDKLKIHSIHINKSVVAPPMISKIHKKGWFVYVWTADTLSEIRELNKLGVDGVFSNDIEIALKHEQE